MNYHIFINLVYIASALLFVIGLKMLSSPTTARRGNLLSAIGMLLAIVMTLLDRQIIDYQWIIIGLIAGSIIGLFAAFFVKMTQMPEMVALLNGFGGIASLLVGCAVYNQNPSVEAFTATTIFLSVLIGGVTFTGSLIAYGKLSETINSKAYVFKGQQIVNSILLLATVVGGVIYIMQPEASWMIFIGLVVLSFVLGVMAVIPIGGGDMPVVISLLNSYSGLAACAAGFVIQNNILIVAGSLVGASGIILTNIMCKAMNRSLAHVLFSGFGSVTTATGTSEKGEVRALTPKDASFVLEAARSIAFVPGYGMAVAQAQHVVKELGELLEENGCEIRYAVHPVAGRMPGHMNVLLAEADVPYEQLAEMDDVNRIISTVDVCIVIGANDVVNPGARDDPSSSIYGMPIIEVDRSKTVFVLKRSMRPGFAGIDNPLFFKQNTRMVFGDAKNTIQSFIAELKEML